jgi:uncharacterized protein (DUF302 family)/uncharacterized membrane protein YidH (DUF202 family)
MGFGFVVARFGLFLRALQVGQSNLAPESYGLSFWVGTLLIALGVIVDIVAAQRHVHLIRELNAGGSAFTRPSSLGIAVAVILALLGLVMAVYLISVRDAKPVVGGQQKAMTTNTGNGIVSISSNHSVDKTVENLQQMLQAKGVKLFALVDHSGEAAKAGLQMPPTKLLIFGNPKAGTPLMLAAPSSAIDLPLKILVWEDTSGKAWISYNSPAFLQARHNFPANLVPNIAVVETLAAKAAE